MTYTGGWRPRSIEDDEAGEQDFNPIVWRLLGLANIDRRDIVAHSDKVRYTAIGIFMVASLAWGPEHGWLNVNADLMAAALAAGLRARRLLLMTDVDGVLDETGSAIPLLTVEALQDLIDQGAASDGMIPKLRACRQAIEAGVREIVIAPRFPGAAGAPAGTRVVAAQERLAVRGEP